MTPRSDHICLTFPDRCAAVALKKKPTEYLNPFPWTSGSVDHILGTPGFSDAEREAMLGATAAKLLGLGA